MICYLLKLGKLIRIGSGFVLNNISHNMQKNSNIYFGIDINMDACLVTSVQSGNHQTGVNIINTDGFQSLDGLKGKIDVLIFNPVR